MKSPVTLIFAMVAAVSSFAQTATSVVFEKDVVYSHAGGAELKLDIARPAQGAGPFPVVVYFHGGGWQGGKRQDGYGQIQFLASQGYIGVTVSYRFVPEFPWPAQVYDAKTAVRYVRAHAKELNIDPTRIAAAGDSAGAYLALMLALTGPEDGLEGDGEWSDVSSRVAAAVSFYSACDFTRGRSLTEEPKTEAEKKKRAELEALFQGYYKKSVAQVLADMGGTDDPKSPRWKQMSPINYVSSGDAPILIIQGDADPIVAPEQAHWLDEALTQVQVPHDLLIIKGGGHGFTREQYAVTSARMIEFLTQYLQPKAVGLQDDTSLPSPVAGKQTEPAGN